MKIIYLFLPTSEGTGDLIRQLSTFLADRILNCPTAETAQGALEVFDVFLVGGWDLRDLICCNSVKFTKVSPLNKRGDLPFIMYEALFSPMVLRAAFSILRFISGGIPNR